MNQDGYFKSAIYFSLLIVVYSNKTIHKTITYYDTVILDCNRNISAAHRWEYNDEVIFSNGINVGNKLGYQVQLHGNGSLYIGNVTLDHEGTYVCYAGTVAITSYHLHVEVSLLMYFTVCDSEIVTEVYTERNSKLTLTCHANGTTPDVELVWLNDYNDLGGSICNNEPVIQDGNSIYHSSLSMTIKPITKTTLVTCLSKGGIRETNFSATLKVVTIDEPVVLFANPPIWSILLLLSAFTIVAVTFVGFNYKRRRRNKISRSNDIQMNNISATNRSDATSHVGTSAHSHHRGQGQGVNLLGNISLTSRLTSPGSIEYWLANTRCTFNSTVIVRFMSENATVCELLTFRALGKNLSVLNDHDNVVKLLHIAVSEVHCYIYNEYVGITNLKNYWMNNTSRSSTSQLMKFAVDVTDAMIFLNNNKYNHPALASRKVLLTDKEVCKVYDIWPNDLSQRRVEDILQKEIVPSAWLAPETLLYGEYSDKSDVWSFGIFLWEIFSYGATPYKNCSREEIANKVEGLHRLSQPSSCSSEIYSLMLLSWNTTSSKRPSFDQLREDLCQLGNDLHQNLHGTLIRGDYHEASYNCLYSELNKYSHK
ncbi:uncharacterized protein [Apostichopus japonicus]|uniref:uncharacterized protein isoform X2 n=1 Tax=Stichopus japonicus TaxID=307972 RepID=UPI003AB8CDD0